MNKILLEIKNLKKSFKRIDGQITLFENFNIKLKEGELVALVGPSGSGKSSLLHLLGLLDEPSKGIEDFIASPDPFNPEKGAAKAKETAKKQIEKDKDDDPRFSDERKSFSALSQLPNLS